MSDEILTVNDLHKIYPGGVHAVKGISFKVHEGESVAIIGSSGSGKSTVLRCINRLIEPTSGDVLLNGKKINTPLVDINEIRSRIGMVFQSFNLIGRTTVIKNVLAARVADMDFFSSILGIYGSENKNELKELLNELNITKNTHKKT